jgi:uncharacterized membrane protein YkvA (DUF1232 family)
MRDSRSRLARAFSEQDSTHEEEGGPRIPRPRLRRSERREESGDRETLKMLIRDIPSFLKLLGRLYADSRVSKVDKALVVATIGYLVMPMDLIPDFIPFLGQLDDLFLLALSLNRLLNNAGVDVLLDHWDGQASSLEVTLSALERAGAFLPDQIRDLLRKRVG